MLPLRWPVAAVLLQFSSAVLAHSHDDGTADDMGGMKMADGHLNQTAGGDEWYTTPSYSGLSEHSGILLAHIILMVLAWFFILPIGIVFSISRSRYTLPVQLVFLLLNGLGVIFSTIYNFRTPDLYENNAHHTIGWIATWVMTAQVVMTLLFLYSGRSKAKGPQSGEHAAFLPVSAQNMVQHNLSPYHDYRWSGDSGQGTERSSTQASRDISPNDSDRFAKPEPETEDDNDDDEEGLPMPTPKPQRSKFFRIRIVDDFLSRRVPGLLPSRLLRAIEIAYSVIDRTILILGFVALATGGVTYAGIFRGVEVFSGLAHWIKGGIFFWYGLLTLGRWMGCFADLGWAWNVKPTRSEVGQWRFSTPSAEFVESFLIFFYGSTNVFLEHLTASGKEWSAQDLEHVSIAILFFGGGLAGMLVESKWIRNLLNTSVDILPARSDVHSGEAQLLRQTPRAYAFSLNPIPALIIMLLGIMMSSHHQDSMVATAIHKYWGTLLSGAALARCFTYILTYLSPPTSLYPSRPPTELLASFCLVSGGLVFMASARDTVRVMEDRGLMAMFIFTVLISLSAFIMAYEVLVLALKGWAVRRELKLAPKH